MIDTSHMGRSLARLRRSRRYLLVTLLSALGMFALAFYVPVVLTPGNTIPYQLSLMEWYNYVLIGLFSLLFGLSFGTYQYAASVSGGIISLVKGGSGSSLVGFTGALFSSPVCVSCLSAILAVFGMGGSAITIFQHQTKIQLLSVAMLGGSFYFASLKLELDSHGDEP